VTAREQALADPIGVVVDLVRALDTGLGADKVADVVAAVAGGRAKRRRLALALLDNPSVLTTGRSPAPSAAGELLLALRRAGATGVEAPYCAGCGRAVTKIQRRGEDWYCTRCFTRPLPCASCGHQRYVASRDRQGQPRCGQCPDEDSRDPLAALVAAITTVDASLPATTVAEVVQRTVSKPGHWLRLAWIIEDDPALLIGKGCHAPVPALLRLISALRVAGAVGVIQPACPLCLRVMALSKKKDGQRICRACSARDRAVECAQCGAIREPAARDERGRPLCPTCLVNTPINLEPCRSCGRRRRVSVRTADGPVCETCRPWHNGTCTICGRTGPCLISKTTGKPWCGACKQRRARCVGCSRRAQIRAGTIDAPLCGACAVPDPGFWRSCPSCGTTQRLTSGPCSRCNLGQLLHELLAGPHNGVLPQLQLLHDALAQVDRPSTALSWLSKDAVRVLLAELAAGRRPLTHATLDRLPPSKTLAHLRAVLVATGSLPERDEHFAGLERWIADTIATRTDPDQRQLLSRYAVWHLLRRLRGRNRAAHATHQQISVIRRHVGAAGTLLEWLTTRNLTLASCRQDHLDQWLTSDHTASRREAGHFVRWALTARLTRPDLSFPATRWAGPSGAVNAEHRWSVARQLLHDDTLKPEDRVAGLLLLLYAQRPATISRLTVGHIERHDTGTVLLHLGSTPVVLPEPLATLTLTLIATRTGHAVIGAPATTPWLFPGGRPGHPVSAYQMGQRLHGLDIQPALARSTALLQLAAELPAAILARTLGIHIAVAVAWQRAAAGDWTTYAAELARKRTTPPQPRPSN
jgi:hypothetical protein